MRVGDLNRGHRFRKVLYLREDMAISGTLEFFQSLRTDDGFKQVVTISGWVSGPLDFDDEIEVHSEPERAHGEAGSNVSQVRL